MKKTWLMLVALVAVVATPFVVLAQDIQPTADEAAMTEPLVADPDVTETANIVYQGIVSGNWWLAAGAALTILVWALRKYGSKFFPKLAPYLKNPLVAFAMPVVLSCLGAVVDSLLAGKPINVALQAAIKPAMAAVWFYVGKSKYDEVREAAKQQAAAAVPNTAAAINVHTNGPGPQP